MDLLAPQIHCFKNFLIDVYMSSLLPPVTTYFNDLSIESWSVKPQNESPITLLP